MQSEINTYTTKLKILHFHTSYKIWQSISTKKHYQVHIKKILYSVYTMILTDLLYNHKLVSMQQYA